MRKIITVVICFCLLFEQFAPAAGQLLFAQTIAQTDISGIIGGAEGFSGAADFSPVHLRCLAYNHLNGNLRFMLDKGSAELPDKASLDASSEQIKRYFLIGLTLPNSCFWVNLRPDSPDNMIDPRLAQTDIGRIMLEADVQLKKDTALATSPMTPEGKEYWKRLYEKARDIYEAIPAEIPALARPWIVPDEIIISEHNGSAYIYKATLKVMLEKDYLKMAHGPQSTDHGISDQEMALNEYAAELMRQLIIPVIIRKVNGSKAYAPLRQVYYSLIMAQWFKARRGGTEDLYTRMIDKNDLSGLISTRQWDKNAYFQEYKRSFAQGEYSVKELMPQAQGQLLRLYFSGGIEISAHIPNRPGEETPDTTLISGSGANDLGGLLEASDDVQAPLGARGKEEYSPDAIWEMFVQQDEPDVDAMAFVYLISHMCTTDEFRELLNRLMKHLSSRDKDFVGKRPLAAPAPSLVERFLERVMLSDEFPEEIRLKAAEYSSLVMDVSRNELQAERKISDMFSAPFRKAVDSIKARFSKALDDVDGKEVMEIIGSTFPIKYAAESGKTVEDSSFFLVALEELLSEALRNRDKTRAFRIIDILILCSGENLSEYSLVISETADLMAISFKEILERRVQAQDQYAQLGNKWVFEIFRSRVAELRAYFLSSDLIGWVEDTLGRELGMLEEQAVLKVKNKRLKEAVEILLAAGFTKEDTDKFVHHRILGVASDELFPLTPDEVPGIIMNNYPGTGYLKEHIDLIKELVRSGKISTMEGVLSKYEELRKSAGMFRIGDIINTVSGSKFLKWLKRNSGSNRRSGISEQRPRVSPDPLTQTKSDAYGGVDFSVMPIVFRAVADLRISDADSLSERLGSIDLRSETKEIESLLSSGVIPSWERLKDLFYASCLKGESIYSGDKMVFWIREIFRREEAAGERSRPLIKDIFILLETDRSGSRISDMILGKVSN